MKRTTVKLCECGCGRPAPIAPTTNRKWGHVKGQPSRFVKGHHQRAPIVAVSELDLMWLAGLLEGEASFMRTRRKRTPKYHPAWWQRDLRLAIAMIDRDVIARVAAMFGTTYRPCKPSKEGYQVQFATSLHGPRAIRLMTLLRPHMGARRKKQIDLALAHVAYTGRDPAPDSRKSFPLRTRGPWKKQLKAPP